MEIGHDCCCSTTLKALHSGESASAGTHCATTLSLLICPKLKTGQPRVLCSRHATELARGNIELSERGGLGGSGDFGKSNSVQEEVAVGRYFLDCGY